MNTEPATERGRKAMAQWRSRVLASKAATIAGLERSAHADYGKFRMDMTWITGRLALGGGIWNSENMAAVARAGITHVIDMQIEFDDTPLARPHGIEVLWNPTDDDFEPKPPELFQRGVEFAERALQDDQARVFVHCAAGVHRAAMMALAILCADGWDLQDAMRTIVSRRPVVDFAEVYVESVERFLQAQVETSD
jgi:protein-tyrosine phosphatase